MVEVMEVVEVVVEVEVVEVVTRVVGVVSGGQSEQINLILPSIIKLSDGFLLPNSSTTSRRILYSRFFPLKLSWNRNLSVWTTCISWKFSCTSVSITVTASMVWPSMVQSMSGWGEMF